MLKTYFTILTVVAFLSPFFKLQAQDSSDCFWEDDFEIDHYYKGEEPFIELNYGFGKPSSVNYPYFAKHYTAELKLGYWKTDSLDVPNLVKYRDESLFISNISKDLEYKQEEVLPPNVMLKSWQFGFAVRKGYGFQISGFSVLPYNEMGVKWSSLKFVFSDVRTFQAQKIDESLKRFEGGIRFGTFDKAGISFGVGNAFSFNAGYEYGTVFPRYLVWKHLGSVVVEFATRSFLYNFIDDIFDNSPYAVPFASFVLKEALSYAFLNLKKEKMYWPFKSEAPLLVKNFNFGISVKF